MSSINSKKSKEKINPLDVEKANVVYDRLRRAFDLPSDEALGNVIGVSKQAIGQRRRSGKWYPQEILDLFPEVNYEWITSDDLYDLRTLPVRIDESAVQRADSVEVKPGGLSDQAKKELAGQIVEIAKILKDSF